MEKEMLKESAIQGHTMAIQRIVMDDSHRGRAWTIARPLGDCKTLQASTQ